MYTVGCYVSTIFKNAIDDNVDISKKTFHGPGGPFSLAFYIFHKIVAIVFVGCYCPSPIWYRALMFRL